MNASVLAPFTDEPQDHDGLFTDLVHHALRMRDPERSYRIDFVNAEECFEDLVTGNVDVVAVDVLVGEHFKDLHDPDNVIIELENLSSIITMHVLALKANPYGRTMLSIQNRGLHHLAESGEWFTIVSGHLTSDAYN